METSQSPGSMENYGEKRQALRGDAKQNKQRNDSLKKDLRNKAQDLKRQQLADIIPLQRIAVSQKRIENCAEGIDIGPETFLTVFPRGF